MRAALAALWLAAQASAPAADVSPDQRTASLATAVFGFACVQRVGEVASTAAFARESDALGAQIARDHPQEAARIRLDGAAGRGCRVRYLGPFAARLWQGYLGVLTPTGAKTADGGGCTTQERTAQRVRALCLDTASTPPRRGRLTIERTTTAPTGEVTAEVTLLDR